MDLIHLNRRRVLAAIGSSTAALLLPGALARAAQGPAGPPVARKEPVRESLWGEEIVDPYRWMENPKDAEWESFMKGQAAHARRITRCDPRTQGAVRTRDTSLSGDVPIARVPQSARGRAPVLRNAARPVRTSSSSTCAKASTAPSVCWSTRARCVARTTSTCRSTGGRHRRTAATSSTDCRGRLGELGARRFLMSTATASAARTHRPDAVRIAELATGQQRLLLQSPGRGREARDAGATTWIP